jgi:protein FAM32A
VPAKARSPIVICCVLADHFVCSVFSSFPRSIELTMTKSAFLGGALSFKGDKKKAKKKNRKAKHHLEDEKKKELIETASVPDEDDELTEAERKAFHYKLEKDRKDLENVAAKSHRERIEEFNEKLGQLTEHNDIPRVSAAGNG